MLGNGDVDIIETVFGELGEEIGLYPPFNGTIRIGKVLTADRKDIELHIVAVQIILDEPHEVVLNDEHNEALWLTWGEYIALDTVPIIHGVRHHFSQLEIEASGQALGLAIRPVLDINHHRSS